MSEQMPKMYRVKVYVPCEYRSRMWRGLAWSAQEAEQKAIKMAERLTICAGMGNAELAMIEVMWSEEVCEE